MTSPKNKPWWTIEGEELEEHLANDCELTIIEPYIPFEGTEYTKEERMLLDQFPPDADYDEVLTKPIASETGEHDLLYDCAAMKYTAVGDVFRTARYWCLRVKHEF